MDKVNWTDILKDAVTVGIGAGLAFMVQNMGFYDFGQWMPAGVVVMSVAVNVVRKMLNK